MVRWTHTIDELADEIGTQAAHLHAATCRWLELIAEFDDRGGWATHGAKSCAHWVSWRCGVAPGAAREHVRVARRLRDLPLVRESFARGELSYSKVRALTRVENVAREAELVELATTATAAQLERIVRGYRGVLAAEAGRAYDERYLRVTHDWDGSVVIRGRLPRDEGALLLKALELVRERSDADLPAEASLADEGASGASRTDGAGVPAGTPRAVEPGAVDPPGCRRDTGARLADALVDLAEEATGGGSGPVRGGGDRYQVVVHVDAATLAGHDDGGRAELEGGEPLAVATVQRLCCDAGLVAMIERDGQPLSVGRKTRSIPPALRRALRKRDGGCAFPGCTQRRWVDAHHIVHWAHGGETSLSNLVQLCRHHHRLVHEGGFSVERRGDGDGDSGGAGAGGVIFRRPDGRPIRAVPPAARRSDPGCVAAENERLGHRMAPETCLPRWAGERLDLAAGVDAVLAFAPPARKQRQPPDRPTAELVGAADAGGTVPW